MNSRHLVSFLLLAVLLSTPALAQTTTPKIDKREQNQRARIRQGVKSGELTKPEARKLAAQQAKIRTEERRAKADGKVTLKERAKINRDLNKANRRIAKEKHDSQTR